MRRPTVRVLIVGLGAASPEDLELAGNALYSCLGLEYRVLGSKPLDPNSFNARRKQYKADSLVDYLSRGVGLGGGEMVIGIVSGDGYVEGLNFVLGLANPVLNAALVFLPRLSQEFYGLREDREVYKARLVKEVLHEVGHLMGLAHCSNPRCVMRFSNTIWDTDEKEAAFCPDCANKLGSKRGVRVRCVLTASPRL